MERQAAPPAAMSGVFFVTKKDAPTGASPRSISFSVIQSLQAATVRTAPPVTVLYAYFDIKFAAKSALHNVAQRLYRKVAAIVFYA